MNHCRIHRFDLASAAKTLRHKTMSQFSSPGAYSFFLTSFLLYLSLIAFQPA